MKRALRKMFSLQHIRMTPQEREVWEIREFWASLPASERARLLRCFADGIGLPMEQKAAAVAS